jgi:DNA-binding Lrp family transcriptional regulator
MVATAYVLINVESGKSRKVYDQLQKISNITDISAVTGPYDLIVTIQSTDFNVLGRMVLDKIQAIDGVEKTLTCNVIEFEQ